LRRRKEKKRDRKSRKNQQGESSDEGDDDDGMDGRDWVKAGGVPKNEPDFFTAEAEGDDDPFNDPFFKDGAQGQAVADSDEEDGEPAAGKTKKKDKGAKGEAGKSKKKGTKGGKEAGDAPDAAELELLMMDDQELRQAALRGDTAAVQRARGVPVLEAADGPEKVGRKAIRKAKALARKALVQSERVEEEAADFKPDLKDPRFKDLFSDHLYALDPTDPKYKEAKKGVSVKEIAQARKQQQVAAGRAPGIKATPAAGAKGGDTAQHSSELRGMVAKLKRKGQQLELEQGQQGKEQRDPKKNKF